MSAAQHSAKWPSSQLLNVIIGGFEGTSLPDDFREALDNGLGGVILFARNYKDQSQLRALTESIKSHNPKAVIAVDQEGGRVVRFAGDFPAFPSPGYFGDRDDLAGLCYATEVTAKCLKDCGVNCNLIPVCDLRPSEANHVIRTRAYSASPDAAAEAAVEQVRILREQNLISCAKHFPGLASAAGDPHQVVSQTDQSSEQFRTNDYKPFAAAINAGCNLVMPTHLMAPELDQLEIATFSKKILQGELRNRLGFEGPIISDDLQMLGALSDTDLAGAAIKSLSAGCDLLICGNLAASPGTLIAEINRQVEGNDQLRDIIGERSAHVEDFRQNNSGLFT